MNYAIKGQGALQTYKSIEKQDPGAENALVMGPWIHGGWGYAKYDDPTLIPFKQEDKYLLKKEREYLFVRKLHILGICMK